MTIQWFPGHMAKARREVTEKLKLIDVVLELLDARLPLSSRNPMMDEIVQKKPRLILLNKSDLADSRATALWVARFAEQGIPAVVIDAAHGSGLKEIQVEVNRLAATKQASLAKKGIRPRAVRAMILGIPNVGKSSLINRMAKRSATATGDRPGVTKAQQWIRVGTAFELLDTPGILWPKFDDPATGLRLAASGAIKSQLLDHEDVVYHLLTWLGERYPDRLAARYGLTDLSQPVHEWLQRIGEKRGAIRQGGIVDTDAAALAVLRDFQTGALGRITLEWPGEDSGDGEASR